MAVWKKSQLLAVVVWWTVRVYVKWYLLILLLLFVSSFGSLFSPFFHISSHNFYLLIFLLLFVSSFGSLFSKIFHNSSHNLPPPIVPFWYPFLPSFSYSNCLHYSFFPLFPFILPPNFYNFLYCCTVHFEIYLVHSPTNALFINLVKSSKFTLKYTIISFLHVSAFNGHHHGALSVPN